MAVASRKHFRNTHRLGGSSHLLESEPLVFWLTTAIFLLKMHVLLAALAVASASGVVVATLIDLKIQLSISREEGILECKLYWYPKFSLMKTFADYRMCIIHFVFIIILEYFINLFNNFFYYF